MNENKEKDEKEVQHPGNPQEDEKNGNVLGKAFDKLFGDSDGGGGLGEDEANDPDKQESIKTEGNK